MTPWAASRCTRDTLVASTKVQLRTMVRATAATAPATALKLKICLIMSVILSLLLRRLALCDSPYVLVLYITTTPLQTQALTPKIFVPRCKASGAGNPAGEGMGPKLLFVFG